MVQFLLGVAGLTVMGLSLLIPIITTFGMGGAIIVALASIWACLLIIAMGVSALAQRAAADALPSRPLATPEPPRAGAEAGWTLGE